MTFDSEMINFLIGKFMKKLKIHLNIWDDFCDEENGFGETDVQIEGLRAEYSLEDEFKILNHFLPMLSKLSSTSSIYLYDTNVLYPHMDKKACENTGFKHQTTWKLKLDKTNHKLIHNFIEKNKKSWFSFENYSIMFISES